MLLSTSLLPSMPVQTRDPSRWWSPPPPQVARRLSLEPGQVDRGRGSGRPTTGVRLAQPANDGQNHRMTRMRVICCWSAMMMTGVKMVGPLYQSKARLFHAVGWARLLCISLQLLNTYILDLYGE